MSRAYLRVAPDLFERKVVEQGYALPLFAAFVGVLCLAEHQPHRGRFRDQRVLRALLGPAGRWVPELVNRGDLIAGKDGSVYVDGWDEWQEGDVTVGERVKRIRTRRRVTVATVTPVTVATVDTPSERSVIDGGGAGGGAGVTPPPPSGATRREGTNPRSVGTNPRAKGTNLRAERQREKTGPTAIGEILRRAAAAGRDG